MKGFCTYFFEQEYATIQWTIAFSKSPMETVEEQTSCLNLMITMNKLINLLYSWVLHILVLNVIIISLTMITKKFC